MFLFNLFLTLPIPFCSLSLRGRGCSFAVIVAHKMFWICINKASPRTKNVHYEFPLWAYAQPPGQRQCFSRGWRGSDPERCHFHERSSGSSPAPIFLGASLLLILAISRKSSCRYHCRLLVAMTAHVGYSHGASSLASVSAAWSGLWKALNWQVREETLCAAQTSG